MMDDQLPCKEKEEEKEQEEDILYMSIISVRLMENLSKYVVNINKEKWLPMEKNINIW